MQGNVDYRSRGDQLTAEEEINLQTKLWEAKVLRKKVEEDARLLQNRIKLLQFEEKRAAKKIDETRKKAKEVMQLKSRNLQVNRQKEEWRSSRIQAEIRKSEQNRLAREAVRQSVEANKSELRRRIIAEVEEVRRQKTDNREQRYLNKANIRARNEVLISGVKDQERRLEEKKKRLAEEKKGLAGRELEDRLQQEESARRGKEAEIAKLERVEVELIQRLQHTQNVQKEALRELQDALGASPAEERPVSVTRSLSKPSTRPSYPRSATPNPRRPGL
eukprot:TRINITY_DN2846_c0_g1_i1.p1 TRINITY_DN2846_c0_g1~~TRINITY_DN2846_c0_g1_i1.p1  ORF type:complete len:276 (-),score=67.78 TRINITY_DN2846_c0_g1_i1:193-1020(-)